MQVSNPKSKIHSAGQEDGTRKVSVDHSQQAQSETEEMANQSIQEKLTRARKRMRQFKKKLGLMKVFIEKYEKRALEKGSQEIYSAVMILVEEHEKYDYGLNQEESEVLERMKTFGNKFSKIWGMVDDKKSPSSVEGQENGQIVAKLRSHEFSDKFKNS